MHLYIQQHNIYVGAHTASQHCTQTMHITNGFHGRQQIKTCIVIIYMHCMNVCINSYENTDGELCMAIQRNLSYNKLP